jgi:ABC-type dipeptide/oligopeptide/nickel transport system permease component
VVRNETGNLLRRALRRVGTALAILLVIAYLTIFGLLLAQRGRQGLPMQPLSVAVQALIATGNYILHHPATYYWHRQNIPALELVLTSFARSAALLVLALAIGALLGVPLGIVAASRRNRGKGGTSLFVLVLSIVGISTPSFLLAMLLWVLFLQLPRFHLSPLPAAGFGWDNHMILPALVLSVRPLAQVAQVTYVTLTGVLTDDYVRTARGKGLSGRWILLHHALPNIRIPVLTTLGTTLRYALSSLPVVEYFFLWTGLGLTLLQAIDAGTLYLVVDLTVALGLLFLVINLLLDLIYPLLDRRLAEADSVSEHLEDRVTLREQLAGLIAWAGTLHSWYRVAPQHPHAPAPPSLAVPAMDIPNPVSNELPESPHKSPTIGAHRHALRAPLLNPSLVAGGLLVLAFVALAFFGERLAAASPYVTHGVMMLAGKIGAPPYAPSPVFPWGSDQIGRDIQALVLAGGRRTLVLACTAALARVLAGSVLGGLAGWWRGGRLDQIVTGGVAVWAAFPATVFAMIIIQALGIQQGMWVFVVALCVVGWGEVAQFVRSQVVAVRPLPYIESARAVGARSNQVLLRHVFPNVLPALVVLTILELGGVLVLLAELGFLNVFMGGGFRAEITAGSTGAGQIFYYSDVPEWGALLANVRTWWRTYPWLAWYPGIFFFLAILAFNIWGEGIRRFLAETRFNVNRLFNRYALLGATAAVVGLVLALQAATPINQYWGQAAQFDANRALADIQALAGPGLDGRETGLPGGEGSARYIAKRMAEVGLFPAGEKNTYLQSYPCPRTHFTGQPSLAVLDGPAQGNLTYREDFTEFIGTVLSYGNAQGNVVGLALGPAPGTSGVDQYGLTRREDLAGKIVLMREGNVAHPNGSVVPGELIITANPAHLAHRLVFRKDENALVAATRSKPILYVSEEAGDRLLRTMGSSLAEFDRTIAGLAPGEVALTANGPRLNMAVPVKPGGDGLDEQCYNVIGFIPGTGSLQRLSSGESLDSQVIMLSAYYDGEGRGPDGTLYPGANDNASAVASLLEIARVLKTGVYAPAKTVVFVAWSEGERGKPLMVSDMMNAKTGFSQLKPEAVIELSGLGGGRGQGLALGQGSSYRLVQLLQRAAGRMGVETTTRGRDPHVGLPPAAPFGTRSALTAYVSWDGSDLLAHTPQDTPDAIDPARLRKAGQAVLLATTVLSREVNY